MAERLDCRDAFAVTLECLAEHDPRIVAVVNDSLGTVDPADSTGTDEQEETGDAKSRNKPARED